jgi:hypothetical protein
VTSGLGDLKPVDIDTIQIELPPSEADRIDPTQGLGAPAQEPSGEQPAQKGAEEDPNAAIMRALERDAKK